MEDWHHLQERERGSGLLIEHFAALERLESARTSARSRLEASLGDDLTRLLVGALTTAERPIAVEELDGDAAA